MKAPTNNRIWKVLGGIAVALIVGSFITGVASQGFASDFPGPDSKEAVGAVFQALSGTPGVPKITLEYIDEN